MACVSAGLPAGIRLTDHVSLGVIARTFPPDEVRRVLAETGRAGERRRDLPAPVMVYYAIALALYAGAGTREVLRCLLEGLRRLWGAEAVRVAGKSGISQARTRLGAEPLHRLYERVVRPIATPATKGAWYRAWRLVSLDGSCLDVADTEENRAAFGRPEASRGESAFPQLRDHRLPGGDPLLGYDRPGSLAHQLRSQPSFDLPCPAGLPAQLGEQSGEQLGCVRGVAAAVRPVSGRTVRQVRCR